MADPVPTTTLQLLGLHAEHQNVTLVMKLISVLLSCGSVNFGEFW